MTIAAIIALITDVAPKLIAAGVSVYNLWREAGDAIADAEANGGKVDPAAYAALQAKCEAAVVALEARANEA